MRKSKLFVAIAALILSTNLFASHALSSDREKVNVKTEKDKGGTNHKFKTPVRIPFEVWVDSFTSIMEVYFLADIGELEISLVNIYTGESVDTVVDSSDGSVLIPFSATPGLYSISFFLSNGKEYNGEFEL